MEGNCRNPYFFLPTFSSWIPLQLVNIPEKNIISGTEPLSDGRTPPPAPTSPTTPAAPPPSIGPYFFLPSSCPLQAHYLPNPPAAPPPAPLASPPCQLTPPPVFSSPHHFSCPLTKSSSEQHISRIHIYIYIHTYKYHKICIYKYIYKHLYISICVYMSFIIIII